MQDHESLQVSEHFISVQSVVIGPEGRLWILDTGRPQFQEPQPGGPKLMAIDLASNEVAKTIALPPDAALPTTYLNDVRFDLSRGDAGLAFITDSSSQGGIIVVDLASGESWRRITGHRSVQPEKEYLPIVEARPLLARPANGEPQHVDTGSDGIAIGPMGERLYYCPLASRQFYSVSIDPSPRKWACSGWPSTGIGCTPMPCGVCGLPASLRTLFKRRFWPRFAQRIASPASHPGERG